MTDTPLPDSLGESTPPEEQEDQLIEILRKLLAERGTGALEINRRLDFLVAKLGVLEEVKSQVASLQVALERNRLTAQTILRTFESLQAEFDNRTAIVLRDAELLRGTVRDSAVLFQQAQEHQNADWDDKWQGLQAELDRHTTFVQREVDRLSSLVSQSRTENATVTVSRIGRTERIAIALLVFLGSVFGAIIGAISK